MTTQANQISAFKQITLERLPVHATQMLDPNVLQSVSLEWFADDFIGRLTANLAAYILAERIGSHTEQASASVPATWWDHWKQDHPRFTAWWSKWVWRWMKPARQRTFTVTAIWTDYATFPRATFVVPDQRKFGPVVFQRLSGHEAEWSDPDS
jgi:hypothetical protein